MTHREAAARRRELAGLIAAGAGLGEVATRYGVSMALVVDACREAGVPVPRALILPRSSTYRILADLINTPDRLEVIAVRHGVTRQRVDQIKRQATDAGIVMHPERINRRRVRGS